MIPDWDFPDRAEGRISVTIQLPEGTGELTVIDEGDNRRCEYHGALPRDLALELTKRYQSRLLDLRRELTENSPGESV